MNLTETENQDYLKVHTVVQRLADCFWHSPKECYSATITLNSDINELGATSIEALTKLTNRIYNSEYLRKAAINIYNRK